MKKFMLHILIILGLLFGLSACNFPIQSNSTDNSAAETAVVQTVAAHLTQSAFSTALAQLTPVAQNTPTLTVVTTMPTAIATVVLPTILPTMPAVIPTATAYVQPTLTPGPTQTPTPLRPGGTFDAPFLTTPPAIDGVWDEWKNNAYPAKYVVYGGGNRTDENDLEGSFRVGWDNQNLYIAVKMLDDKYVQNASGVDLYQGDSIEILLDTNLMGDLNSTQLSADDFQLGISFGRPDVNGTREAYLWYPGSLAGSKSGVVIVSVRGNGVTRMEAAIPWSVLGVSPSRGMTLGFALSFSDNDKESENVQQSMVSSAKNRSLLDPTTWGLLNLK
ncbi:MAG TPA: sugar-binding protein [Anaerolineaceae bacterium]|nr:sugar-binding protein [Anaerolineaceae bacterium]